MVRVQSMRRCPGRPAQPRGDLREGNMLQVTHEEDLATVGGQFLEGIRQQHGLLAPADV